MCGLTKKEKIICNKNHVTLQKEPYYTDVVHENTVLYYQIISIHLTLDFLRRAFVIVHVQKVWKNVSTCLLNNTTAHQFFEINITRIRQKSVLSMN